MKFDKDSNKETFSSFFKKRWSAPDFPGAEPRFSPFLLSKDVLIFLALPSLFALVTASFYSESSSSKKTHAKRTTTPTKLEPSRTQIIRFTAKGTTKSQKSNFSKKSPGTLVKLRLLNKVETYSNAPVHAIVIDNSLGGALKGARLIGEAIPDSQFNRINIEFNYLKHPQKDSVALSLNARAMSLNGTLGLNAEKKEGYFARVATNSAQSVFSNRGRSRGNSDVSETILKALVSGLSNESGRIATVENNNANVLVLKPGTIFFAELTEFFPKEY